MKQRIITGVSAGAGFVVLLALGQYPFSLLILALAVIGYDEFARMNGSRRSEPATWLGYAVMVYMVFPWERVAGAELPSFETLAWLIMFVWLVVTVLTRNRTTIDNAALLFLGAIYIGLGFHYMIETRDMEHGLFWTLFLFFCIWVSDAGAYFTGKAFGRTKLWPAISPNKTVEGAVGGVVLAALTAVCFALYAPELISLSKAVLLGVLAAVVGTFGDLIQSAYKRVRGVKDSGTLLPGHGGVLDRCDSWLIVFPFVQLLHLL